MKRKTAWTVVAFAVTVAASLTFWYNKGRQPARPDPAFYHTPEGVNAVIQEQRVVLAEALLRKDLQVIHGQMYYVQGLADALSGKLEGERKQRVDQKLVELKRVAEEIDNFSGRGNAEATDAGLKKLFESFDALNIEFKHEKK